VSPSADRDSWPLRHAGLTGGVALLLLAGLAAVVAVDGLVTQGDAAQTANDIMASPMTFRLGVASLYLVIALDIVAPWALFRSFAPVSTSISRRTAWLRLAFASVFLVAISQLAGIPARLIDPAYEAAFGRQQLQAQAMLKVEAFNDIWMAALLLFGAHLIGLGYLAYRSGYAPRIVGILLVIAGGGYAFDTFSSVLSQNPVEISTYTFVGEFLLAVWLVVRGARVRPGADHD
jgi:hypothetical protein